MSDAEAVATECQIADDITFRAAQAINDARPLFLIVYYEHESVKISFLKTVAKALHKADITPQTFDPSQRPDHGAGRLYPLLAAAAANRTLALIASIPLDIDSSAPAASFLSYLNLHRDQIHRDKLRMVLFLHSSDAARFMASAGDLWDFRHHTYWLEGLPSHDGISLWQSMEQEVQETGLLEQDKEVISQHLQNIRALIEQTNADEEKAALLLDLSMWLSKRHALAASVQSALEGLHLASTTPTKLREKLESSLGYALFLDNNMSDALIHYQRALAIRQEIGDKSGAGITLNNISQIYVARGDYDAALKHLKKSLAIRQKIGDKSGEGVTLNNIATTAHARGDYETALEYLKKSLAIRQEIGDKSGERVSLNNISQIFKVRGDYGTALEYLKKSLAINQEVGDKMAEGVILNNISQIHDARGDHDTALKYLKKSLAIQLEIGDKAGEWATLNNMATIAHARGDYDTALEYLQKSLTIRQEIGDKSGEGVTLNNISQIFNARGDYDTALEYLNKSLTLQQEIGNKAGEGVTCWNLSREYQRRGNLVKAIEHALRTVEIEEETQNPDVQKSREFLQSLEKELAATNKQ